jgi:hypothetical protein
LYVESESAVQQKLANLKKEIRSSKLPVFEYSPSYRGLDSEGKPELSDLESFGERFASDFWKIIDRDYPITYIPPDEVEAERNLHDEFCEVRTRKFVGRKVLHKIITFLFEGITSKTLPICC